VGQFSGAGNFEILIQAINFAVTAKVRFNISVLCIGYGTQGTNAIRTLGQKITAGGKLYTTAGTGNKKAPETGASKRVQENAL
jgi:hypothetical protein